MSKLNIHNLAAWRYNQFALLRTDEDSTGYKVYEQRNAIYGALVHAIAHAK